MREINGAEDWWELAREYRPEIMQIIADFVPVRSRAVEDLVANKNPELWHLLQEAWWRAPDEPWIHRIPGWGVLCDLCSEGPILFEGVRDGVEEGTDGP